MSHPDNDARALMVSDVEAHALLWHLLDGFGGVLTVERPPDRALPPHQYVILWRNEDGTVELVAQNERPDD